MVCIPEVPFTLEDVAKEVADSYIRGKKHCIIMVAEGAQPHTAEIAQYLEEHKQETGFSVRLSILGHIQRGGSPSAYDRFLGTRLGAAAVEQLYAGQRGLMVGLMEEEIITTPLSEVTACTRTLEEEYFALAKMLAR